MPEKINKESPNLVQEHHDWLKEKFPSCFSEGKLNFKKLEDLLQPISETREESYSFSWAGRSDSIKNIHIPAKTTLVPQKDESINFDNTENIFIEGENLESLKLLQKSYTGKIKMIYIDPPYNTGNDFIYKDDFKNSIQTYLEQTGQKKDGIPLTTNRETSGRFHSDWLSFMYARLSIAHKLLRDDGVIFISIGDEEIHNLRFILDQIFGEENFEGHIHWRRRHNQPNDPTKMLAKVGEHILVFAKNSQYLKKIGVGKIAITGNFSNPDHDPRGDWGSKPWKVGSGQSGTRYTITTPTGKKYDEEWMGDKNTFEKLSKEKRIIFPNNGTGLPRKKYFKFEREAEGQVATNWWRHEDFGSNQEASDELFKIFGEKGLFDNPKPSKLIKNMLDISNCHGDDIAIDFFAGTSTFADAILKRNNENSENVKFICIQIPELISDNDENSQIIKFLKKIGKHPNIAELGKERIHRVIKNIHKEGNSKIKQSIGFKVFKLAKSNYKVWDDVTDKVQLQEQLQLFENPLIENYKDLDVIYEVIIKEGYSLNSKIEETNIKSNKIYKISDDDFFFYVVLDKQVKKESIEKLKLDKNIMFVCLDAALDDSQKTNLDLQCKLKTI